MSGCWLGRGLLIVIQSEWMSWWKQSLVSRPPLWAADKPVWWMLLSDALECSAGGNLHGAWSFIYEWWRDAIVDSNIWALCSRPASLYPSSLKTLARQRRSMKHRAALNQVIRRGMGRFFYLLNAAVIARQAALIEALPQTSPLTAEGLQRGARRLVTKWLELHGEPDLLLLHFLDLLILLHSDLCSWVEKHTWQPSLSPPRHVTQDNYLPKSFVMKLICYSLFLLLSYISPPPYLPSCYEL